MEENAVNKILSQNLSQFFDFIEFTAFLESFHVGSIPITRFLYEKP